MQISNLIRLIKFLGNATLFKFCIDKLIATEQYNWKKMFLIIIYCI